MPIAARRAPQQRISSKEGLEFQDPTHFKR
jgi:hypothetical protein